MGKFTSHDYDKCRKWIQDRFESVKKPWSWDEIKNLKSDTEEGKLKFLSNKEETDEWPSFTIAEWEELVEEMKSMSPEQIRIREEGSEGALYDLKQDNNLKIPINPRSAWQLYRKSLKWDEDEISKLELATHGLLRRLSDNTSETGPIKGLVIGHVQSGKTANMEALMAMAADHGWNMFIVLSGSIESLRIQTLRRMLKDLNKDGNVTWRSIDHPSKRCSLGDRTIDMNFRPGAQNRYFTVCLKNASRLKNLIEWIHSDSASHKDMKILIIDDEADQAGISNTATTPEQVKKERKGINKLIVNLVDDVHYKAEKTNGKAKAINYVMYTATPYANFLNEASNDSLFPKDFIWTLKPSDNYIGPVEIFGGDDFSENDGLNIKRKIEDDELDIISDIYSGNCSEIPDSMKKAFCWFVCTVAVRRFWGHKKPVSMLIHTSQKQDNHANVSYALRSWYNQICRKEEFLAMCREVYEEECQNLSREQWIAQEKKYAAKDSVADYPSFDEITDFIREITENKLHYTKLTDTDDPIYDKGLHLVVDNCANSGKNEDNEMRRLVYPDPEAENYPDFATAFVVIGGNTLSRGLTIEGLTSTYFLRGSCQADTLMQMGRWFGYRMKYELLPRIWMTEDTTDKFRFLADLEIDLRNDLRRYMNSDVRPDEYGPRLLVSPSLSWLRLTSKKHSTNMQKANIDFTGARPQTTIFDNDYNKLNSNIRLTENFLDSFESEPVVSWAGNAVYWEHIPLNKLTEGLFKHFSFSDRGRVFNEIGTFISWAMEINGEELNNWTVIVAGTGNVQKSDVSDSGLWNVRGWGISKVNRSRLNHADQSILDIKALRTIKDTVADVPEKYVRMVLNGESHVSNQAQVDMIRKAAGRENIPLLIIYRIDKDSKPLYENAGRIPLDAPCDVIGMHICIPGEKTNSDFTKRVTVRLPEHDKEDEVDEQ